MDEISLMRISRNYTSAAVLSKFVKVMVSLGANYAFFLSFLESLKSMYVSNTKEYFLKKYFEMKELPYLEYFNNIELFLEEELKLAS